MTSQASAEIKAFNKVEIYGPSFSNFVRSIMVLCEEYQIDYCTGLNFAGEMVELKSEQHFKLHPYGKFPIVKHQTFILCETASICRYIQTTFMPKSSLNFTTHQMARIDAFSAIISIYLDKALIRDYLLEFVFPKGDQGNVRLDVVESRQQAAREALVIIENELQQSDTLNNEQLSIADVLLAPILHYLSGLPAPFNLIHDSLTVRNYLNSLMARESVNKILIAPKNW
ncbi:glutathione S-transferase family protein [Colwellia sp. 1_MG-2023]|uniref:glutathione S-transferase family protein n=1 Tax=Colwellia sp. 1_MG-2023 TaxID=3062649 RepID=UPI0026E26104|nr:glutathione S-transferase family protein [Colwellia sp. 1_MG-2023]MDO6447481.1 glutathione S-transferase family protein [Colwellia sp. 1_MG-2023]